MNLQEYGTQTLSGSVAIQQAISHIIGVHQNGVGNQGLLEPRPREITRFSSPEIATGGMGLE